MKFQDMIEIAKIKITPNRQRRQFDLKALNELSESIKTFGLFHPIILRREGEAFFLVSGERRLRAVSDIHDLGGEFKFDQFQVAAGHIPYTNLGELSPLEREEAELSENIHRADLTWQERASATARVAELRKGQAVAGGKLLPTVAVISEEVRGSSEGIHHETTRREIIVAKYLEDPEVRAAKSVDDAFKLLKRKEEVNRRVELAATVGKTFTAEMHTLRNEDCLAWMAAAPAESFDVILTDPPYGMGADEFGDSGGLAAGAHGYSDSKDNWDMLMATFAHESFRLAKPRAHAYVFCDIDQFHEMREMFRAVGWLPFRTPFIWHKPSGSRAPWPEYGPQRKWECLLYACKGNRPVTRLYPDLVAYAPDTNLGHAAQKPVALFTDLLRRSVSPGDSVLDPFCGTGPVFSAAHELKCKATGIELDPASFAIAYKRLEGLKSEPELSGL